ncbi:MAG: hypothetical protein GX312_04580 [Candidatus Phytoplasma sp.]|nr:hypothetical protein [Phytoplasma sp.]
MRKLFALILSLTSITLLVGCYQKTHTITFDFKNSQTEKTMKPQEHRKESIAFSKIESFIISFRIE